MFDPYNKQPGPYFTEKVSDSVVVTGTPRSLVAVLGVTNWGPFGATYNYSRAEILKKYGSYISTTYPTMKQVKKLYQNYQNPNGVLTTIFGRVAHYTDITDPSTLTAKKSQGELYDKTPASAIIGTATAGSSNAGDEVALSSGTYTGTTNGVYEVKVTTAGVDYAHSVVSIYYTPLHETKVLLGTQVPISGTAFLLDKGVSLRLTDGGDSKLTLNDKWDITVEAAGKTDGDLRANVYALYHGSLGNEISVNTIAPKNGVSGDFGVEVYVSGTKKESWDNLSPDMDSDMYFVTYIAANSDWIRMEDVTNVQDMGISQSITLLGGDDGLTGLVNDDYVGDPEAANGLYQFATIPYPLRIICPDNDVKSSPATLDISIMSFCDGKRTRNFHIMNVPKATLKSEDIVSYVKNTLQVDSKRGALYFGWGIDEDDEEVIPLTGAIAGLYATIADTVGCWENPAGDTYKLLGFSGLHFDLSSTAAGILNENRVNVCEVVSGEGLIVNGSRTLAFTEAANYSWIGQTLNTYDLEARLEVNCKVRHNLSREKLYARLRDTANNILSTRNAEGGLDNETGDPYKVICDSSIQTSQYKDKGVTCIRWGIRNWKTSEFQWFELTPFTDGSSL